MLIGIKDVTEVFEWCPKCGLWSYFLETVTHHPQRCPDHDLTFTELCRVPVEFFGFEINWIELIKKDCEQEE